MANNNNQNNNRPRTREEIQAKLLEIHGDAWRLSGALFEGTSVSIGTDVENILIADGIDEIDRVLVFPIINEKSHNIEDFGMVAIFTCGDNRSNIHKLGNNKVKTNFNRNEHVDLSMYINNVRHDGGFMTSDKFKAALSRFALFDNNDEMIIRDLNIKNRKKSRDKNGRIIDIAAVDLDFWALSDVMLGCQNGDGMEYKITRCDLINANDKNGEDYKFEAVKRPSKNKKKGRHNNNAYDYDMVRKAAINSYNRY